jgi:3-hydroxybutyryl-CoA dehydratase
VKGLEVGQTAVVRRTFTKADLDEFASLSGALPLTEAGLARTIPGPLLAALFSYILGTKLPGRGTNYLKQRLHFLAPAHLDEEITATVAIIRLRPEKDLVNLRTVCQDPRGQVVCDGEALVLVKDLQR